MFAQEMTRSAGEARMRAFVPRMGDRYSRERNFDLGPGNHDQVSCLSPFVRRRLVLESDLVAAALAAHGAERAEKFIQEVFWRGYFKGWMEHRPAVWQTYVRGLAGDLDRLGGDPALRARVAAAEAGATGIECFDCWARELVDTGYLHNHARMWFASIWIFTLDLPWRVGADFFYRHLLDGDPASNTLSWRWVAGLHTRGKAYAADASNIRRYTRDRFQPGPGDFTQVGEGLALTEPDGLPEREPLRTVRPPDPAAPAAVLITEEDCRLEDFGLQRIAAKGAATLAVSRLRSARPVAEHVIRAEAEALADAASRSGFTCAALDRLDGETLADWALSLGASQIVTPYVPQGPLRDALVACGPGLAARGIQLCEWQRDWDRSVWPHASAGFFKVKEKIPVMLRTLLSR